MIMTNAIYEIDPTHSGPSAFRKADVLVKRKFVIAIAIRRPESEPTLIP